MHATYTSPRVRATTVTKVPESALSSAARHHPLEDDFIGHVGERMIRLRARDFFRKINRRETRRPVAANRGNQRKSGGMGEGGRGVGSVDPPINATRGWVGVGSVGRKRREKIASWNTRGAAPRRD